MTTKKRDRTELQNDILELYLCLYRNVLAIPNPPLRNLNDPNSHLVTVHDRAILSFTKVAVLLWIGICLGQIGNH